MRTVARSHTRIITDLRRTLTRVTRHNGTRDLEGVRVSAADAWEAYETVRETWNGRRRSPTLRELDPGKLYEIHVSRTLRYELRPSAPALYTRPAQQRVDVIATALPTRVRVFLDGIEVPDTGFALHVVGPGLSEAQGKANARLVADTGTPASVKEALATEIDALR
ncbi:hypothetical protein [Streptacidiphilus sp. EB103A]|uniref:hypothetical protein n=1 Tax=Streptacidiphilus sp. EB103A TaxID=3156275 RepID=UPI0035161D29